MLVRFLFLLIVGYCCHSNGQLCTDPVCHFHLDIARWRTMTYTKDGPAFPVELSGAELKIAENSWIKDPNVIGTVLNPDDVITGDGYVRDVITINDEFPGPNLHVLAGAEMMVHVYNRLAFEATSIHWHGLSMRNTPWMDGVAYVTQCPILPRQKFTYRFRAEPHGTHWYHAQLDNQRLDGLYGMVVIHPTVPTAPQFTVLVSDWLHYDAVRYEMQNPFKAHRPGPGDMTNNFPPFVDYMHDNSFVNVVQYYSSLINGRGRWEDEPFPLTEFKVKQGQRNRFRLANVGLENSFDVSVDGHKMDIVAVDGHDIVPIRGVDFILLHTSETLDVEIDADQAVDRYWLRAVIRRVGVGPYPSADNVVKGVSAIMAYEGASGTGDPMTLERTCDAASRCVMFNCLYEEHPTDEFTSCVGMQEARSMSSPLDLNPEFGLDAPDDEVVEYFFNFAFPEFLVSVNGKKYVNSRAPLYMDDRKNYITECDETKCRADGCLCTNIHPIPFNKTIQLVVMSYMIGFEVNTHHTIHLHGHSFAVLKVGYADQNTTTGLHTLPNSDIRCTSANEKLCTTIRWRNQRPELNKESPPIKNSIGVPSNGYAVIRFRSTNPGYWYFRCHMEQHFLDGMMLVLNEAPERHPPPPPGFPTCRDFEWEDTAYAKYISQAERIRRYGRQMEPDTGTMTEKPGGGGGPQDPNTDGDEDSTMEAGVMPVRTETAIGAAVGFVLLGAFLPISAILLYMCCVKCRQTED